MCVVPWLAVLLMFNVATAGVESFTQRFEKENSDFGAQFGWGETVDIPSGLDRTDLGFAFFFPNWQYNLTGLIGDSWYRGAWFYHMEAGLALSDRSKYLVGWSPLMVQYKFFSSERRWSPNFLFGGGFALTNWKDVAYELGSELQFLLHCGAGLEYFKKEGTYSVNYRFFHVSNGGIRLPNTGLNAHLFTLGVRF